MRPFSLSSLLHILANFHLHFDVFSGEFKSEFEVIFIQFFSAILNEKTTRLVK